MSTRFMTRLIGLALCATSAASCGGELLRTGRSPAYLVVNSTTGDQVGGAAQTGAFLLSDVEVLVDTQVDGKTVKVPTYFNDNATVNVSAELKNPTVAATAMNNITLTRYHVEFRRTDGRNTPGADVPYAFDGGLSTTVQVGSNANVAFELVRHQAKLEPPLRNLRSQGGQVFISAIAEITLYGRDQNGNEVTAKASMDVHFGDFADKTS